MKVTVYTTHCPKCKAVETKLKSKNIDYIEITDENEMQKLGFQSVPVIDVDGKIMNFSEAINWINNYIGE